MGVRIRVCTCVCEHLHFSACEGRRKPVRAGALGVSVAVQQGWVCVESLWSRSPHVSVSLYVGQGVTF